MRRTTPELCPQELREPGRGWRHAGGLPRGSGRSVADFPIKILLSRTNGTHHLPRRVTGCGQESIQFSFIFPLSWKINGNFMFTPS